MSLSYIGCTFCVSMTGSNLSLQYLDEYTLVLPQSKFSSVVNTLDISMGDLSVHGKRDIDSVHGRRETVSAQNSSGISQSSHKCPGDSCFPSKRPESPPS